MVPICDFMGSLERARKNLKKFRKLSRRSTVIGLDENAEVSDFQKGKRGNPAVGISVYCRYRSRSGE
jgi:hypothetical protein